MRLGPQKHATRNRGIVTWSDFVRSAAGDEWWTAETAAIGAQDAMSGGVASQRREGGNRQGSQQLVGNRIIKIQIHDLTPRRAGGREASQI